MKSLFAALFVAGVGIGLSIGAVAYESTFLGWLGGANVGALAGAAWLVRRSV